MEIIVKATLKDIPQILPLVNSAYRGEVSKKGWTTEANIIEGDQRTDEHSLAEMINNPNAAILLYKENDLVSGCVYLEKQDSKLYLGMLSVNPEIQGGGIGKKLLRAAETHAEQNDCNLITMTVISLRKELIAWYERNGYADTGERKPFPDDAKFGKPIQPLTFIVLEKPIV